MSRIHMESYKGNRKLDSNSSSSREVAPARGGSEVSDKSASVYQRSASPSPSVEIIRLRKHRLQQFLESEREKERLEKEKSEREKKREERRKSRETPEVLTPKNEKKRDSSAKLMEIRSQWAKAESNLISKAEASIKEQEAHLKHFYDQRLSLIEARSRSNRSRFEGVRECRSQLEQEEELVLLEKLEGIRRKMERSTELHSAVMMTRSQSAARKRGFAGSLSPTSKREDEESARLLQYLRKLQSESSKKTKARLEDLKEKESLRKAKQDKWKKVESNLKSEQQKVQEWTKSVEEKHNSLMATIESRISENLRTVACRSEQQKERTDLCLLNRAKLQRMRTSRQADLLCKWVERGKRIEALKQQRALSVERHRGKRLYEALEVVTKSPESRKAKRLLKGLEEGN